MNDRLDMALFGLKNLFSGQPELERVKASGVASSLAGGAMPAGSLLLVARKQPGAHVVH
jgi:hypothetical protein